MLKIASLSLAALLALASPTLAAPKKQCYPPSKFTNAERIEGAALAKFREIAVALPADVDLVLIIKDPGIAIGFAKGCAVSMGTFGPVGPAPKPKADDGSI